MKCRRCGKQVNQNNGYETEDGDYIHHGCAMLENEMPRKKMAISLADLIRMKNEIRAESGTVGRPKDYLAQ